MKDIDSIISKVFCIFLTFLVLFVFWQWSNDVKMLKAQINADCESCKLCNLNITSWGMNGMYRTGEYFCVWTKNRTNEEIIEYASHEACHEWVHRDYDHFCSGDPIYSVQK